MVVLVFRREDAWILSSGKDAASGRLPVVGPRLLALVLTHPLGISDPGRVEGGEAGLSRQLADEGVLGELEALPFPVVGHENDRERMGDGLRLEVRLHARA